MDTTAREVRVADDGRVAQRFPSVFGAEWLVMTVTDGLLGLELLTGEKVAGWRTVWPDPPRGGRLVGDEGADVAVERVREPVQHRHGRAGGAGLDPG